MLGLLQQFEEGELAGHEIEAGLMCEPKRIEQRAAAAQPAVESSGRRRRQDRPGTAAGRAPQDGRVGIELGAQVDQRESHSLLRAFDPGELRGVPRATLEEDCGSRTGAAAAMIQQVGGKRAHGVPGRVAAYPDDVRAIGEREGVREIARSAGPHGRRAAAGKGLVRLGRLIDPTHDHRRRPQRLEEGLENRTPAEIVEVARALRLRDDARLGFHGAPLRCGNATIRAPHADR